MKTFTEYLIEASGQTPPGSPSRVKMQTARFKDGDDVHVRLNGYTTARGIIDRVGDFGYHVKFTEGKPSSFHEPSTVHASYDEALAADKPVRLKPQPEPKK